MNQTAATPPTANWKEWWQVRFFETGQFIGEYFQPLQIIKNEKREFISWAVCAFFVGTFVFWEPIFSAWIDGTSTNDALQDGITHKELLAFGIIWLAEGVGTVLASRGAGKGQKSAGIRGNLGLAALIIWGLNFILYYHTPPTQPSYKVIWLQFITAFLSILLAVFLYCLRKNDWETPAARIPESIDAETKLLNEKSKVITKTGDGVKI